MYLVCLYIQYSVLPRPVLHEAFHPFPLPKNIPWKGLQYPCMVLDRIRYLLDLAV